MNVKTISSAVFILLLFSCTKNRVCNCTITSQGTTNTTTYTSGIPGVVPEGSVTTTTPFYTTNTVKTKYSKVSKYDMRSVCFTSSEESINSTTNNSAPGLYSVVTTETGTKSYSCKIE
jgi:hypothetical protein